METLFYDFRQAHLLGSGPLLSSTLVPIAPAEDPNRLRRFSRSSTSASIAADIRAGILYKDNSFRISKQEGSAWVDVYASYWRAINEIVALSEGIKSDHNRTYESWKELTNCLIKGYSSSLFGAWTVPCLYVVGRYLRIFAIKADATEQNVKPLMFDAGLQDDVASSAKKSDKLEEAARIINRIFTLCISDRYEPEFWMNSDLTSTSRLLILNRAPLEDSRKWGLYYTTNLLFKTYFKASWEIWSLDINITCSS